MFQSEGAMRKPKVKIEQVPLAVALKILAEEIRQKQEAKKLRDSGKNTREIRRPG
jgi:hypothetical protein